ncbi:MAG: PcfJ domain-containing protein [Sporomusaceae bacterium]|nr:PcfJ domain-containing protein [Sporomusaceae bacterium]
MLVKSELSEIPVLAYPHLSKDDVKNYSFVGTVQVVKLPHCGKILVADVFDKKSRDLKLRFFSDGKNALICNEWPTKIWLMKLLDSVLGYGSYLGIVSTDEDAEIARNFLGGYSRALGSILNGFISNIYSEKSQKAMERKYAKMQEHFAMYPDYPADLPNYCEQHVFNYSYIFMDKLIKGKRHCVCAHCKKQFTMNKGKKSGDIDTCPKCGITIRYRGAWVKSTITNKAKICIAHKFEGQLLLRWTNVERTFLNGSPKYQYSFDDYYYNLYLHSSSGPVIYAYSYQSSMSWGWNWFRKRNGEVNYSQTHVYSNNITEVFGQTYYHVNLVEGLRGAGELSFVRLLDNLKNIPSAEYLFKLGLTQIAATSSFYVEKLCGKSFSDVLGVSKQYLPLYRKFNITRFEHEIVKSSRTWVAEESFAKFRTLKFDGHSDDIIDLLDSMSFERFANYFTKQKQVIGQKDSSRLIIWYKDYISMSKSLGVDLSRKSIRFPSNIKIAHDVILERFNKVKHKLEDENFAQAREKLYAGMKEYAKGDYCIVFPKTRSEFIAEGQSLNHCVGGDSYYQNHLKGKRMVFFVRRTEEPSKPFFTMEIDMRQLKILQLYGYSDCTAPAEVRKFANEFLRRLSPAETVAS